MSKNIQMKMLLDKNSKEILNKKLKSYNLDKEMNYAVVVLKVLINNSECKNSNELAINLVPKVHFVAPFVTKRLAGEYIKELSTINKLVLFLQISNGNLVIKDEDVNEFLTRLDDYTSDEAIECGEMSETSTYNLIAYKWANDFSEKEKENYAYKAGGVRGYSAIRTLFDNWKFDPEI